MSTFPTAMTSELLRKADQRVKPAQPLIAAAQIVCFFWKEVAGGLGPQANSKWIFVPVVVL